MTGLCNMTGGRIRHELRGSADLDSRGHRLMVHSAVVFSFGADVVHLHMPVNYHGLSIPFVDFGGGVTSDSLFAPKEAEIFRFYRENKDRYRRALDIGANIGVHTCLMLRQGWHVRAFEPDDGHNRVMEQVINDNAILGPLVSCYVVAVSDHDGTETFVRVKGNTTGSHLKGDKNPYGELEEFEVRVVDCRPLITWADFCKMDCEGHEARILLTVTPEQKCEFMVEVGNQNNADAIYNHFAGKRGMWAQQSGWKPVLKLSDVPSHHSEGALFIGWEAPFG